MKSADDVRVLVRETGGPELVERIDALEAARAHRGEPQPAFDGPVPDAGAAVDYDVLFAGGGLSLLLAPLVAERGLRVAVLEKHRTGTAHREWNASGPELTPLVESGLFAASEVESMVLARYDHGICRWHEGGTYPVRQVLDNAVDAGRLMRLTRERAQSRGVEIHDGAAVIAEAIGTHAVALRVRDSIGATHTVTGKVLVDARGASSPYASADLVCPTVGGVMRGLDFDAAVGDILVTTEGIEDGRQHMWEGFPGRRGEITVYLFYYALADSVGPNALFDLYARYFSLLSRYKSGGDTSTLVRPTFGYIPGWSRLKPPPKPPGDRCFLVGDAAARHSPLTFCGFGNMLRSFVPAARRIAAFAGGEPLAAGGRDLYGDLPLHSGTGALSTMMAVPSCKQSPHALNSLLDAAFATLYEMGDEAYGALLRDSMQPRDFIHFLRETARKRPSVYQEALACLGLVSTGRWGVSLAWQAIKA